MSTEQLYPGLTRRGFLAGAAGLIAGGLLDTRAAIADGRQKLLTKSPVQSVILINMAGGMSHLDTLDHKERYSAFSGVRSKLAGMRVAESFSRSARELHRVSAIRTCYSEDGDHRMAQHLLHTGYRVPESQGWPDIPSYPALLAYARTDPRSSYFPSYVTLGSRGGMIGRSGFLGVRSSAFHVGNLKNPVRHLQTSYGRFSDARHARRGRILDLLNGNFDARVASQQAQNWKQVTNAALEFMNSERLNVFDLKRESARTRARFGKTRVGQQLLMAKRLAQAGVPFIEVTIGGWDTHRDNKGRITKIMKDADPAIAALLGELGSSGLLSRTLFVLTSEFGRTPVVEGRDGRDHYPRVWTTLIGGAGIMNGNVLGASNARGERAVREGDMVHMRDLHATILTAAGIKTDTHLTNSSGRPFPVASPKSRVRKDLLA